MGDVVQAVATVAAIIPGPWQPFAQAYLVASNVYGAAQAKKQAAREQVAMQAAQKKAYNDSLQDRTMTRIAADSPAVFVYGRAKVGSTIVAVLTSGDRDEYKHLICVHASHECDAIEEIYINGNALGTLDGDGVPTSGKYAGKVRVKIHLGTPSDPADATLMAECPTKWASTAVLRDHCYTYVRLDLNEQEFQGGLPSVEVLMRGKKLYDFRSATTAWCQNSTLVIYDYLTSDICGVDAADLPSAQWIAAANVCDESLALGKRYTFNGTITGAQDPQKVLEQAAQSMAGSLVATTWDIAAGKYVAPVLALAQEDIVGDISIVPGTSDTALYNGVRGQYISSETLYVATDFKPYQNAAYVAADGRELWTNIDFPFTDGVQRVHNLARIFAEDQRNGYTVKAGFSLKAWDLKIGDRVTLTSALFGWSSKVFRVTDKTYSPTSPVELTLKEDAASIWDEADAVTADSTPNTGLPDPFAMVPPGNLRVTESKYSTTGSAGVKVRATIEWDAPANVYARHYELEYRLNGASAWIEIFDIPGTLISIDDIAPGVYEWRVKCTSAIANRPSDYSPIHTKEIYGLLDTPADITGFAVRVVSGQALATLGKHPDLDVRIGGRIVLRWSPLTSGATWAGGCLLSPDGYPGDASSFPVPLLGGTYMAKAKDSTGHYSANVVSFVLTEAHMTGFTTLATVTEHPAFSGSKSSVVVVDSGIQLVGATLFDDLGAIDSVDMIDSAGGIVPSGSYAFANRIDLGSVLTVRLFPNLKSLAFETGDTWDSRTANIDDWGLVDGDVIEDAEVALQVRTTDDDPAGAPTWGAWHALPGQADYTARAFEFRALLTSADITHNRRVTELSVAAKQPT